MNLEEELKKVLKDGEILIGVKRVKKSLLKGGCKMVITASNAPRDMREDLERFATLSGIPYYEFEGTSKELGYACARPFPVTSLAIMKEGSSNILKLAS